MFGRQRSHDRDAVMMSLLAEGLEFTGDLRAKGQVRLDGRINGLVQVSGTLIVGAGAIIDGDATADTLVVAGRVTGDLIASSGVTLHATAVVDGNIRAANLSVESGATINGRISIGEPSPQVQAAAPAGASTLVLAAVT